MPNVKEEAEKFWKSEYSNKWKGSTMKAIILSAFAAGYEKGLKHNAKT